MTNNFISKNTKPFHSLSAETVLKNLKSSRQGLTEGEALSRAKEYGANKLPESKKFSNFKILLNQFINPFVYILAFAGGISLFFNHLVDFGVIAGALIINAVIGFIQEKKADNALSKLKNFLEPLSLVIRDGKNIEIKSAEIVPGDIVYLRAGNNVPADLRLIEVEDLEIDEATMTGESMPIEKNCEEVKIGAILAERKSMAFMGTQVLSGQGIGVAVAIGPNTELGQIAQMVKSESDEKTALQIRLSAFSRMIGILVLLLCAFLFIFGLVTGGQNIFDLFLTIIAVAVSSVPEGLPMALTVILSVGMQNILKKKSLVRRLLAAETLGSITAICTDKTGTLTEGRMHLTNLIFPDQKFDLIKGKIKEENPLLVMRALRLGMLANDAILEDEKGLGEFKVIGSPTDSAIFSAAIKAGLNHAQEQEKYPRLSSMPFTSEMKIMAVSVENKGDDKFYRAPFIIFAKGAPEIVLARATHYVSTNGVRVLSEKIRKDIFIELENLTKSGLRIVALAYREIENQTDKNLLGELNNLVFFSLAVIKDPIRSEVKETLNICKQAGIRTIIITGDHRFTASAIALEAGIKLTSAQIIDGEELDLLDDNQLKEKAKKILLYARVSPAHKLRIVKALKENGESVAMTGDGINDAPALKAADIGIALGSGTDVAKETADMVLLDNNFTTIVSAIEEGRIIFANIRKVIAYLISDSFTEVILIAGSLLLGLPLPIIPAQILWVNIINDGFPNVSLAFEREETGVMKRPPISPKEPILNRQMKILVFIPGLIMTLVNFGAFYYLFKYNQDVFNLAEIRTIIFAMVAIDSLFYIFSLRDLGRPVWRINLFSNPYLISAVLFSFLLLMCAVYFPPLQQVLDTRPLGYLSWGIIISVASFNVFLIELVKRLFFYGPLRKRQA